MHFEFLIGLVNYCIMLVNREDPKCAHAVVAVACFQGRYCILGSALNKRLAMSQSKIIQTVHHTLCGLHLFTLV